MGKLWDLEKELSERQSDLEVCNEALRQDPKAEDALEMIPILEADIADLEAKIEIEREKKKAGAPAPPPPPPAHGTYGGASSTTIPPPPPPPAEAPPTVFSVGNAVMAKYSVDRQWYHATIISKTGSSVDPVYGVIFKDYGNTETNKRSAEIRPLENPKKRKADGPPAYAPVPPEAPAVRQGGAVISAPAAVDETLMQRRQPSRVSDGPTRLAPEPKTLRNNKKLEKSKSNWMDWQRNGPRKGGASMASIAGKMNKESQFRTPDLPSAKGEAKSKQ